MPLFNNNIDVIQHSFSISTYHKLSTVQMTAIHGQQSHCEKGIGEFGEFTVVKKLL